MQRKGINKLSKFSLHAAVDWAKSCRNTIFIWMGSTILLGRKWGFTLLRESFNEILYYECSLTGCNAESFRCHFYPSEHHRHEPDEGERIKSGIISVITNKIFIFAL